MGSPCQRSWCGLARALLRGCAVETVQSTMTQASGGRRFFQLACTQAPYHHIMARNRARECIHKLYRRCATMARYLSVSEDTTVMLCGPSQAQTSEPNITA
ncbi:hypothetical protein T440DRAFT_204387 [Plenodomus tracheiphilus IPT5]|uniref:Uncharacterized protein n=1 Tax=Plenodomus tracheiphilus IPT5 TaxID=1408161 RepID=A0A6A7BL02_9PLEO|nr:hypothetical protein T440DRAFT_204387 [Plenodomus tracheiphilus IPT5]